MEFIIWGSISLVVAIISIYSTVILQKTVKAAPVVHNKPGKSAKKRVDYQNSKCPLARFISSFPPLKVLSPTHILTFGIFLSIIAVFIPTYYCHESFSGGIPFLRPFLLSVHSALRIFLVDGDFGRYVVAPLEGQHDAVAALFSIWAAALYVFAPCLTFKNISDLFKNFLSELRYSLYKKPNFYIMSELNIRSVALARDIVANKENCIIVFTEVFEKAGEEGFELLSEARSLGAICLKKDIAHLDILSKIGKVELFLIGEDEEENVSQAVKITKLLNEENKKKNVKIFVFAQSDSSAYIIDSVKYDNLLEGIENQEFFDDYFKLRRINEKKQLVWNTVPDMNLFEIADKNNKTLSVLIAGFGSYGMEFFETILWFCQFEGYKLEINVVDRVRDSEDADAPSARSLVNRLCPEIMENYDVRFFDGIDMTGDDFSKLLFGNERLKRTNVAIVSLGDDNLNIEVSTHLRCLFDKVNKNKADKKTKVADEVVQIYTIVYDEQKSGILHSEDDKSGSSYYLVNHKKVPFNIHFIGSMGEQFKYKNIYDEELEKDAYCHHHDWVEIERQIHEDWTQKGEIDKIENSYWSYTDYESEEAKEKFRRENRKDYEGFEYFRLSSVSKELYKRAIKKYEPLKELTECKENGGLSCECKECSLRKRSEHLRWNAYTRILGFSYDKKRNDRAKQHDNLCEWELLSPLDKAKD